MDTIDWSEPDILFIANEIEKRIDSQDEKQLRPKIEPWLTAVFQSEHLSLLLGTGITTGVCGEALVAAQAMQRVSFETKGDAIKKHSETESEANFRGVANFEDDLRTAIELLKGLKIQDSPDTADLENEINARLTTLIQNLLENERSILSSPQSTYALSLLKRFLISFASRTATRDRLHIFTTNYDRLIEYSLDAAGIHTLDRFVGKLDPILRMHKMELDYHYNPPGIRGEPRYVEGVVRFTKLHGSLDWRFRDGEIHKIPLPFGASAEELGTMRPYETSVIYPNSAKGVDTAYFPYSELFRDFSSATCRPNSVLVTYGYGFGDSHINNILLDMMTIPSTHLVVISYDNAGGRIQHFVEQCNSSQLTLLIGQKLGSIKPLTETYLPKSAIDRISDRKARIEERRNSNSQNTDLNLGAPDGQ